MQMRWGRYGVKSARWIVCSSCPIGRRIGVVAFEASEKMSKGGSAALGVSAHLTLIMT
jgi:hypothetical protein